MTRNRFTQLVIVLAAVGFVAAGCAGDDDNKNANSTTPTQVPHGKPTISIVSVTPSGHVKGNTVSLDLRVSGIDIVKADGDTSGKTGHIHAFIDRVPVDAGAPIPKEPGIVHSADYHPLVLTGLSKGEHTITVVLGDGTHARIGKAEAATKVTIDGPTLDATAPAVVAAGSPVRIDFKADGVSIVKADGDASGKTGHFHVFVDQPLPKAGEPILKPADNSIIHTTESFVDIPGLPAGEHTFYVVLGDGNHVPLSPLVADKVTVTVQ
jgi:hypothetical protein